MGYNYSLAQLEGVSEPVVLQVFVGNDTGRVKPHGFYQACRVTGRNTTACKEVDIEGTTVIEVPLEPSTNMTLAYVPFLSGYTPTSGLPIFPASPMGAPQIILKPLLFLRIVFEVCICSLL